MVRANALARGPMLSYQLRLGGGLLGYVQVVFDVFGKGQDVCQCQRIPALVEADR